MAVNTNFNPFQQAEIFANAQKMAAASGRTAQEELYNYATSQGYTPADIDASMSSYLQPGDSQAWLNSLASAVGSGAVKVTRDTAAAGGALTGTPPPAAPVTLPPAAGGALTGNTTMDNFQAGNIPGSGSYQTEDWLTLLGGGAAGGVAGALAGAGVNESVGRLQSLGEAGLNDYTNLGKVASKDIQFNPYTLTSSLGKTQVGEDGSITSSLTAGMQDNVTEATKAQGNLYDFTGLPDTSTLTTGALTDANTQLGQVGAGQEDLANLRTGYSTAAQGMTGMLGGKTTSMANKLFKQQQAMRQPTQQREALELQNRLLSQGRLGIQTDAYGGTSEQLARNKAVQEQQSADAFNSMTQAEQMATSQQARALGLGNATSLLAAQQQALKTGDIANTQGLFNVGASAANLPLDMQGKQVAQAGQLQQQALDPAAAQLQQVQASGTLGQQAGDLAAKQGGLFADVVGAGLQERLTAESAAAATRTKQYDSILKAVNTPGTTPASTAAQLISQGVRKVGENLVDASNTVIGKAADLLGSATAAAGFDTIGRIFDTDAQFEKDFASGLAGEIGDSTNLIEDAWKWVSGLFD